MTMNKVFQEIEDIKNIIFNREKYKSDIIERYRDSLTSFNDLVGENDTEMSGMFYLVQRHSLYLLKNDKDISCGKVYLFIRKILYRLILLLGDKLLGCTQVFENKEDFGVTVTEPKLQSEKPVIYVANHGFRDDVLATVLAAKQHAVTIWGSLPMFFNTFDGFCSSLIGVVLVNRRHKQSRNAAIDKAVELLKCGHNILIMPEGGWNKTSEVLTLPLFGGVYEISKKSGCDVVPIIHYVRDPEIIDKSNKIYTVVENSVPLYQYEKTKGLSYLRDILSTWQFLMMEKYGQSTREQELCGFSSSAEKWHHCVKERMKYVERYDGELERHSDYRSKNIVRPEDAFRAIANIKNINAENIGDVLYAKDLVTQLDQSDFQRLY